MRKITLRSWVCCGFILLLGARLAPAQEYNELDELRASIVNSVMDTFEQGAGVLRSAKLPVKVKMSGELHAAVGFNTNDGAVFTRASADLNERNFRILSGAQLNNYQNTYDPAIYSRIKVVVDAAVQDAVGMHLNVTVDPWSYTGRTGTMDVTSAWGDTARVQHLFWGNNGYTINHSVNTLTYAGVLALPELKVKNSTVPAASMASTICNQWGQCDSFSTPDMKVKTTFQPVREFWVDIKPGDAGKIRIFPMAYQDQALTSDDPLRLSNNKTWWEASPWLNDWRGGQVNHLTALPEDFSKGYWDSGLAFATRDSDGTHLTALRGVALDAHPGEDTTIQATVASPKTLWQDYNEVTAVPGSLRVKQYLGDNAYIGGTGNMHLGFVDKRVDEQNYVASTDTAIVPVDGVKAQAQVSSSVSHNDWSNHTYRTKEEGQAYFASIEAISNAVDLLKKDYMSQRTMEGGSLYKGKLFFARMDRGFESTLSNYHKTRDDAFWSRHLTFYPSLYRKMPGAKATMSESDQEAFALGNGIDIGRDVAGARADTLLFDGKVEGMADFRHVTTNANNTIENVARTEWTWKTTDELTLEGLALWHGMPRTRMNEDPFVTNNDTGLPLVNNAIPGGDKRNLETGTLGARYQLTEWADVNGVWEYSNDLTLAEDNFPRGLFDGMSTQTYVQNGRLYRGPMPWLYDQGYLPQSPYDYHNIFKTGLHLRPANIWDLYFDYTRNPNGFAGNIDDNMDHFGFETSVVPTKSLGFFARYTLSRGYDLNRFNKDKVLDYRYYHNVFLESRYIAPKDNTFSLQFGVGPVYFVDTSTTNPLLGYYAAPVLSTQHMVRLTYEKRF